MKTRPAILLASLMLISGIHAEEPAGSDSATAQLRSFDDKANAAIGKVRKAIETFASENDAGSKSETPTVIKRSDPPPKPFAFRHSFSFRAAAKFVEVGLDKEGNLPQIAGYWKPEPRGIVFALLITDRPLLFGASWRKEVTVGGKEVDVMYDLDLGTELAPLGEKLNKAIQGILTEELLSGKATGT